MKFPWYCRRAAAFPVFGAQSKSIFQIWMIGLKRKLIGQDSRRGENVGFSDNQTELLQIVESCSFIFDGGKNQFSHLAPNEASDVISFIEKNWDPINKTE